MNAALFAAITEDDDADAIAELLTELDAPSPDGLTPLRHACTVGAWQCAEALLAAGAAPELPAALVVAHDAALAPDERSMLSAAIAAGAPTLATCVLATNTPVDRAPRGWSALHYAAAEGQAEVCAALLARGLPLEARNDKGETPLALAVASRKKAVATVELLVAHGADVHVVDHEGKPLADRIRTRVPEQRQAILAALGATPAAPGPDRSAATRARIASYLGMRVSAALDGTLFGHVPATFWFVFDDPRTMKGLIREAYEDETHGWNWGEVVPIAAVHAPEGSAPHAWLFLDWRRGDEPVVQVHLSDAFGQPRSTSLNALGLEIAGPRRD